MRHGLSTTLVAVGLLAGSSHLLQASPIAGQFNFNGSATVSLLGLDFAPDGGGTGTVVTTLTGNTGDFALLNGAFTLGAILDRDEATQPVAQSITVPDFLQLDALPNLQFTLEFIPAGVFSAADCFAAPANEQTCTPPPFDPDGAGPLAPIFSPYNLNNFIDAQSGLSSSASFTVRGSVVDTITSEVGTFRGVFTATFLGTPYQDTLSTVLGGGSVTVPFSASFDVTAIPEPSTLAMLAAGMALLGGARLFRRK